MWARTRKTNLRKMLQVPFILMIINGVRRYFLPNMNMNMNMNMNETQKNHFIWYIE